MSYYIYKICCDDLPDYNYVGSTKSFRQRKNYHKEKSLIHNSKLYVTIRENGGWDNWRMVILEECGEITYTQARIKEEEHRVKLNANMNSYKCYRTTEEKKEYDKEWKENNKEFVLNYHKEYNKKKVTCDCGCIINKNHLKRHKESKKHLELMEQIN
jgi:hypothetical protein